MNQEELDGNHPMSGAGCSVMKKKKSSNGRLQIRIFAILKKNVVLELIYVYHTFLYLNQTNTESYKF